VGEKAAAGKFRPDDPRSGQSISTGPNHDQRDQSGGEVDGLLDPQVTEPDDIPDDINEIGMTDRDMTDRGTTDSGTTGPELSYQQLLRVPDMRALLLATGLSRLGGRMLSLAIVLYALARADSPALAGWLSFALMAPGLAISPIAGALIDRAGAVWAITADMAASAACLLALTLVDRLGAANPPVLLVLTTLFSLTSPLSAAGIRTLLPRLVPREALDRANALDTSIHGLTDIIGPALAGGCSATPWQDWSASSASRHCAGWRSATASIRSPGARSLSSCRWSPPDISVQARASGWRAFCGPARAPSASSARWSSGRCACWGGSVR